MSQALILYASQENKAGYYVTEDVSEMESVSHDRPFGSEHEEISVRHIVLRPVVEDSAPIQHFWAYLAPVADAETMDTISNPLYSDDFNFKDGQLLVFFDKDSCRLADNYFEAKYHDAIKEEIPEFVVLLAQKNEAGGWVIQEYNRFGF